MSWGNNYLIVKVTYHHHRLAYDLLCSKLRCIGQVAVMIGDFYEKIIGPQTHWFVSGFCSALPVPVISLHNIVRIPTQISELGDQISTRTSHQSWLPPGLYTVVLNIEGHRPGGDDDRWLVGVDICSPNSLHCVGILFCPTGKSTVPVPDTSDGQLFWELGPDSGRLGLEHARCRYMHRKITALNYVGILYNIMQRYYQYGIVQVGHEQRTVVFESWGHILCYLELEHAIGIW